MRHTKTIRTFIGLFTALAVPLIAQAKESPPKNRVPIEVARKVATTAFPGKIKSEELEFEGGKWIYSFDLKSAKDSRVHEVHVDAISGKFLDKHTETAADEKKEMENEANEEGAD